MTTLNGATLSSFSSYFLEEKKFGFSWMLIPCCYFEETGFVYIYWDSKASLEDMQEMWSHSEVAEEWTNSGEKRGKVRFSHDQNKRPYLSRVEMKVEINKHKNSSILLP